MKAIRRRLSETLVVLCALLGVGACPATRSASVSRSPEATAAESPAARQFADWLAAFNAGDQPTLAAYHEKSFPYQVASSDLANLERETLLRRGSGGFSLARVELTAPTRYTAILEERRAHQFSRALIEVDPAPPHRVVHFQLDHIPIPDDLLTAEERPHAILDADQRRELIERASREFEAHYVFPDVAAKMVSALHQHLTHGDYDKLTRAEDFTAAVVKDLRDVSHDLHIRFQFGKRPADFGQPQTPEQIHANLLRMNFGLGTVQRLPGNVAHLSFIAFYPPDHEVRAAIARAMTEISTADALLIDLRNNHGGQPDTVALIASYLFDDKPVHLNDIYWPDPGSTQQFWTKREVSGPRFGTTKPVYILTSKETISAGEELAYDLQTLRRARIVGETTAGGANPAAFHDLDDWFRISVPAARPINPVTKTSWEGVGVVPDVVATADAALEKARLLAVEEVSTRTRAH